MSLSPTTPSFFQSNPEESSALSPLLSSYCADRNGSVESHVDDCPVLDVPESLDTEQDESNEGREDIGDVTPMAQDTLGGVEGVQSRM